MGSELTTYRVNQLCGPTVCIFFPICEQIWEKGALRAEAEFLFLIVHNFKAVTATGLKPGIAILQSLTTLAVNFAPHPLPVWAWQRKCSWCVMIYIHIAMHQLLIWMRNECMVAIRRHGRCLWSLFPSRCLWSFLLHTVQKHRESLEQNLTWSWRDWQVATKRWSFVCCQASTCLPLSVYDSHPSSLAMYGKLPDTYLPAVQPLFYHPFYPHEIMYWIFPTFP